MRLQNASGGSILGGLSGSWGEYNTTLAKRVPYETSNVSLLPAPLYLVSLFVKISAQIAAGDYEILVLDTNLDAAGIAEDGVQGVIDTGGRVIARSDIKAVGGVWGYDPPTEELITLRHCHNPDVESVMLMKGRPLMQGLGIMMVTSADGGTTGIDESLFVDARWIGGQ